MPACTPLLRYPFVLGCKFLNVVEDANSIVYLLMKHFW